MANERIFISYKRKDKDRVIPLVESIERELKEKCWIDRECFKSNAMFTRVISEAIDNASVFLFMYSKEHLAIKDFDHDWTMRELQYADDARKNVVLVKLDDAELRNSFRLLLTNKQYIEASDPEQWAHLLRDLHTWLDNQVPSAETIYRQGVKHYKATEYEKAFGCFQRAADLGDTKAMNNMGVMYKFGLGIHKDISKAADLYRKAAEKGNAAAKHNLEMLYQNEIK